MCALSNFAKQLLRDDGGVTSIEYALIGSLIAVVIVAAVTTVGANLNGLYQNVAAKVAAAA